MHFSSLSKSALTIMIISMMPTSVFAGPIAYGICQTGCNALAVTCYAAAGYTFGTVVASPAAPAVVQSCNAGLAACSTACATVALLAPTP
ncbi:cysteine-rich protein [Phlegmacium glaucopus]|nr:cysteine-rich protein [Phlegmacium glaucopus]